MAFVRSRYNSRSDGLILGHYSSVMPTGRLWACKTKAKKPYNNNLLNSHVRSLGDNSILRPCRIERAIEIFL